VLSQAVGQGDLTFVADGDLHGGFRLIDLHLTVCLLSEMDSEVCGISVVATRSPLSAPVPGGMPDLDRMV
jgi:hypothetical protein